MASIEQPAWQHVCLAHLSRDCNSLDAVHAAFAEFMQPGLTFALSVVAPDAGGPAFDLP